MNAMTMPNVANAKLPATYVAAIAAISKCSRMDECREWADKAIAMASYARQADDQTLRKHADRIQARASRRCGELLKQIPTGTGAHLKRAGAQPLYTATPYTGPPLSRKAAAANAGLSDFQRKTAIRVANVSDAAFERQVESDNPPTVTELAEQGKKKKPLIDLGNIKPANFANATKALAQLKRFAEFAAENDPVDVAAGVTKGEVRAARKNVAAIDSWLDRFIISLGE